MAGRGDGAVFLAMVAVRCGLSLLLLWHRRAGVALRPYGHVLLPVVLLGLGLWILRGARPLAGRILRT